jgi:hypothetical protein
MIDKLIRSPIAWAVTVFLLVAGGTGLFIRYEREKTERAEIAASEYRGRANAERERAEGFDARAEAAETAKLSADAEAARLKTIVARLRTPSATVPPADLPDVPESPGLRDIDLRPLVEAQDALLKAQGVQLEARDQEIITLKMSRDSWKLAHNARQQEAIQLASALAAQKGLAKGQRWLGRLEGFGVGVASGYLVGRFRP